MTDISMDRRLDDALDLQPKRTRTLHIEVDENIYNRFQIMCSTNDEPEQVVIEDWMEFIVIQHERDYAEFLEKSKQERKEILDV